VRDPRSRRRHFNDPSWRARWIQAHWGVAAARRAWGQATAALAKSKGTKMGRPLGVVRRKDGRIVSDAEKAEIRGKVAGGASYGKVAPLYGLSRDQVKRIVNEAAG
jgi:hypothetical protein